MGLSGYSFFSFPLKFTIRPISSIVNIPSLKLIFLEGSMARQEEFFFSEFVAVVVIVCLTKEVRD